MTKVYEQIENGVTYRLCIEQDDTPVRGHFKSDDEDLDRKLEDEIIERLDNGDDWAWAQVTVSAHRASLEDFAGHAYLCNCCYKDTDEFIQPGGYWDDLKAEALRHHDEQIGAPVRREVERALAEYFEDQRAARGDSFATEKELESIKSDPLAFDTLADGINASQFIRQYMRF